MTETGPLGEVGKKAKKVVLRSQMKRTFSGVGGSRQSC